MYTEAQMLKWIALVVLLSYPVGWEWFRLACHLGREQSILFKPVAAGFLPVDVLVNATWGSWWFREWPKWTSGEFMFSSRVKRHYRNGWADPYYPLSCYWRLKLNAEIPHHIELENYADAVNG